MKKAYSILGIFMLLTGCNYLDEPQSLLKEPHYAAYQEKLNTLESSYLNGETTYGDYLEKKRQADDTYTKEVQDRTEKIEGQQ